MFGQEDRRIIHLKLTIKIISAYVLNNSLPAGDLSKLISATHSTLMTISSDNSPKPTSDLKQKPAVSINKSVEHDHITCLEDGKRFKSLKRHLAANHGMTPEQYRAKWGLAPTYPMTAPAYSERRSAVAKETGLGRNSAKMDKAPRATSKLARVRKISSR